VTPSGSVVLVTGAGHGMGRAHCLELAGRGWRVGVLDIDREAAAETVDLVGAAGGEAHLLVADVTDRAAVEARVAELTAATRALDAVVSNAGTIHAETGLEDTDDDDWARTIAVNVDGARNVTRAALPWLRRSEAARIVVVSSIWAQRGPGFGHAYCAAKGALLAFARNLAVELGPQGICVNALAPGSVATRMAAGYGPDAIAEDCKSIPLGRWGTAEEMSHVVAFLVSPDASYLSGQTISVNGGQVITGS
jgi:NAD(P)-dependent dehydrogenase (short-subunit alcohol dehydrogenase family)